MKFKIILAFVLLGNSVCKATDGEKKLPRLSILSQYRNVKTSKISYAFNNTYDRFDKQLIDAIRHNNVAVVRGILSHVQQSSDDIFKWRFYRTIGCNSELKKFKNNDAYYVYKLWRKQK